MSTTTLPAFPVAPAPPDVDYVPDAWYSLYDAVAADAAVRGAAERRLRTFDAVTVACDRCPHDVTVPAWDADLYDAVADGVVDGPDASGTVYIRCTAWPARWLAGEWTR